MSADNTHHRPHYLGAFGNEIGKGLSGLLAGWRELAIQMVTFPLFFLLIVLFTGRGHLQSDLLLPTLLGMIGLTFIHEQVNRVFWSHQGDIQSGVLEQTYLTPVPSAVLMLGRQVAAILAALPTVLAVLVVGGLAILFSGGRVDLDPQILIPVAAIALGTCGLALILCGLGLVYRRIQIVTQISVAVYAILGGTLVPLDSMPQWAAVPARVLIPIAPGIEALRDITLHGHTLGGLSGGGLAWLLAQPLVLLAAGGLAFGRLERRARKRGTLGRY